MYAHVTEGTVDAIGRPPQTVLADGRWWDLRTLDPDTLAAVGWFEVESSTRPDDTATATWEPVYALDGEAVVQTWVERDKTSEELAAETEAANQSSLQTNLEADLVWLQQKIGLTNNALNTEFNNNPAAFLKPLMRVIRRDVKQSLGDYSTPD